MRTNRNGIKKIVSTGGYAYFKRKEKERGAKDRYSFKKKKIMSGHKETKKKSATLSGYVSCCELH